MATTRWSFPGDIVVEPARRRDALVLLALHRMVLEEDKWFITSIREFAATFEDKEHQISVLNGSDNGIFLVARTPDQQVAGMLTIAGGGLLRTRHVGRLEIIVHPKHRGAGIGRSLMSASLNWSRNNPLLTKIALSVFADNTRAIELYQLYKFEEEGRRHYEYRASDGSYRGDVLMYRMVG